ncbi:hypothetical protein, partial [Bosea sp. (in: a-proteobacteria)]|uniref:hypothetical protein n=1 Tax=Bosea sp. (in: a-proteobacteria) TaxID=1871050 RepID=UPI0040340198
LGWQGWLGWFGWLGGLAGLARLTGFAMLVWGTKGFVAKATEVEGFDSLSSSVTLLQKKKKK